MRCPFIGPAVLDENATDYVFTTCPLGKSELWRAMKPLGETKRWHVLPENFEQFRPGYLFPCRLALLRSEPIQSF